jgi:zinc transport system ATP-binding protein
MLSLAMNPLPDILLLDEPVSGVDRVGLKSFYELVSSIRRKCDITILLISHDLDLVARHADRVVFINNATAAVGSVKEIFSRGDFVEIFGRIDFSQNESGGAE